MKPKYKVQIILIGLLTSCVSGAVAGVVITKFFPDNAVIVIGTAVVIQCISMAIPIKIINNRARKDYAD